MKFSILLVLILLSTSCLSKDLRLGQAHRADRRLSGEVQKKIVLSSIDQAQKKSETKTPLNGHRSSERRAKTASAVSQNARHLNNDPTNNEVLINTVYWDSGEFLIPPEDNTTSTVSETNSTPSTEEQPPADTNTQESETNTAQEPVDTPGDTNLTEEFEKNLTPDSNTEDQTTNCSDEFEVIPPPEVNTTSVTEIVVTVIEINETEAFDEPNSTPEETNITSVENNVDEFVEIPKEPNTTPEANNTGELTEEPNVSPNETPEEPNETPEEPNETPEESNVDNFEMIPEEPNITPNVTPEEPNVTPEEPNVTPEEPNVTPEEPNVTPEEPNVTPEEPNVTPEEPNVTPEEPNETPEEPNETPEESNVGNIEMLPEESNITSNETPEEPNETPEESSKKEDSSEKSSKEESKPRPEESKIDLPKDDEEQTFKPIEPSEWSDNQDSQDDELSQVLDTSVGKGLTPYDQVGGENTNFFDPYIGSKGKYKHPFGKLKIPSIEQLKKRAEQEIKNSKNIRHRILAEVNSRKLAAPESQDKKIIL